MPQHVVVDRDRPAKDDLVVWRLLNRPGRESAKSVPDRQDHQADIPPARPPANWNFN